MKNYKQYIKENQHYLTEPYDPEEKTYFSIDTTDMKNKLLDRLEKLLIRMNVDFKKNNTKFSAFHVFSKKDKTKSIDFSIGVHINNNDDYVNVRIVGAYNHIGTRYDNFYESTLEDIEEYIKKELDYD